MSLPSEFDSLPSRREAAIRYLYGRINYERIPKVAYHDRTFKLGRMRRLLARLGHPERDMRIVHVAGTKGKGSTAAMVGGILRAAGERVGVFSSPHIERIEERLAVDGVQCPAEAFVDLVDTLAPVVERMDREQTTDDGQPDGPTYFEIITAMALLHFVRCQVDTTVLEVGLGGRLDSTNVCRPDVSVITNISLDHTQQLGDSLELIAGEKAGIIKPGVPVVSGVTEPGPREVIRRTCRERGSRLIERATDFAADYRPPGDLDRDDALGKVDFRDRSGDEPTRLEALPLGLVGRHQGRNAAVALAVIGELRRQGHAVSDDAIRAGLAAARCAARIEVVSRRPTVIVDGAHNGASVAALVDTLSECFAPRRKILIFAASQEKDVGGMLELVMEHFDEVLLTRYGHNPRSVPPRELAETAEELTGIAGRVCSKPEGAWQAARQMATDDDLICVTGSFFIAAEMRRCILASIEPTIA